MIERAPKVSFLKRLGKTSLYFLVFSITFASVGVANSSIYRASEDRPKIAVLDEKLNQFENMSSPPDIVFMGSSQTFRHISPEIISEELKACGKSASVYNMGVPALRYVEMNYLADEMLAKNAAPPLVIIQDPLRAETRFSNMLTERGRYFRGGEFLGDAIEEWKSYTGTSKSKARAGVNLLRAASVEGMATGRFSQMFFEPPKDGRLAYDQRYLEHNGFWPVDEDENDHVVARRVSKEELERRFNRQAFVPSQETLRYRVGLLGNIIDKFEKMGSSVAYFQSPLPPEINHDTALTKEVQKAREDILVLKSSDYSVYDDVSLWGDSAHMNRRGAEQFSAELGKQLCASDVY